MQLALTLLAAATLAQTAPRLVPAGEAPQAFLAAPPQPGWARAGAGLGFGLAAIPIGLVIGAVVASYQVGQTEQEVLLVAAGLSTPLVGLVPTFAGRSARVEDEHAGKPRLLRIIGWAMTGLSAVGLVASPVIARGLQFLKLSTGAPSILGSTLNLLDGAVAAAAVVVLSISALRSANAAEEPAGLQAAPVVSYLPRPGGGVVTAGLAGSF